LRTILWQTNRHEHSQNKLVEFLDF
jgi:hypothetical protein